MRWIRYEIDGKAVYGIVEGSEVTEVRGDPFAGHERTTTRRPLSSVKLLVPVEPRTFYCAGLNYAEHVIEAAKKRGQEPNLPTAADIGYRANNALVAHRGDRPQGETPVGERGALLRVRLDDWQRRQRAHLAGRRPR